MYLKRPPLPSGDSQLIVDQWSNGYPYPVLKWYYRLVLTKKSVLNAPRITPGANSTSIQNKIVPRVPGLRPSGLHGPLPPPPPKPEVINVLVVDSVRGLYTFTLTARFRFNAKRSAIGDLLTTEICLLLFTSNLRDIG